MSRKIGPVRQLSLQCETPTFPSRRPSLKKQFSAEAADGDEAPSIRVSLSAKSRTQADRPPPIKMAWAEAASKTFDEDEVLTAVKCKEARPVIKNDKAGSRDSILCSRQELSERLRQAWVEREKSKHNLNIFLAQNSQDEEFIENPEEPPDVNERVPKIIPPLQPEVQEPDLKNIFRKHIRDSGRSASITSSYSPTRTDDGAAVNRSDAIVVVPIIERANRVAPPKPDEAKEEATRPATAMSRPATAASRREMFQKRTNSAFNASTRSENYSRPPLLRVSSVPTNPENNKSKFLATKRRVKAKRKDKIDDDDRIEAKKVDIVTMVSLVSPTGSDNEDDPGVKEKPSSPAKTSKKEDAVMKTYSLRKTAKSVSFQQSSIHSVRSFSASFPSRRGSMAPALLIGNAAKKLGAAKGNEKRAPIDDDQIGPKRRLLRAASASAGDSRSPTIKEETPVESQQLKQEEEAMAEGERLQEAKEEADPAPSEEQTEEEKAEDPKEKECWDMYCKMNDRGLTVSFDTILRGMLTPTEYRLRRKLVEQREAAAAAVAAAPS